MMEGDLYDLPEDQMDHAAHWETSILMCLHPDLVEMDRIRDEVLTSKAGADKAGIWGRDPRTDASRARQRRAPTSFTVPPGPRSGPTNEAQPR
jgi:creatinine amidohydrolase/Fe(II)-dependent formamide hydrolase-like protein